ncbi:Beta-amylase 7 [Apostasia shenzhenica]|uniref:Beta-amylase n=1 Tax=Apostasia shenzhenica TaxID=1088818 RepID=A0A2I0AHK4_9ASPA|nr:Beta-amylase 7 [Apostasia shenzhenica]
MDKLGDTSEEDMDMDMEVKEEEEDDERSRAIEAAEIGGRFFEQEAAFGGQIQIHSLGPRRSRPKEEKERTKLRERHRRAITARILAGLRRHGNYNLRVRADINDVIAALAREAGWVVLPDGTTFPSRSSPSSSQAGRSDEVASLAAAVASGQAMSSIRGVSPAGGELHSGDYRQCRLKEVYTPPSVYDGRCRQRGILGGERCNENSPLIGSSMETTSDKHIIDLPPRMPERDFAGTTYVPVFVMLPLGVINMKCELVDPEGLTKQLRILKSVNVDGIVVHCWWGIVEAHAPLEYNWLGYKRLCQIVRELKLKLQVVMSFHECGGNNGDDICIPLPHWVAEIGRSNPDIFFTDKESRRNPECLSWGTDKERVLGGRTALEVYFDYMRSFRVEFDEFFEDGEISAVEVGLGPCGELRYPSHPVRHGWRYPGIGEFQCYDRYMLRSLRKAAEARGHSFWARGPENAGSYNSRPQETLFFCDGGEYDGYYGRFFLSWYSQLLVDHADLVLSLAKLAFEGTSIVSKISGIHWWYKTASHAAELVAGFYNPCNRDGYSSITAVLKRHNITLNISCSEMRTLDQHEGFLEALADPEGLVWQVLNAAWDVSIPVSSENAFPCYDRDSYNKILENVKLLNDPDGRHLSSFTYLRLCPVLLERCNFLEFERFVKRMHGEAVLDF